MSDYLIVDLETIPDPEAVNLVRSPAPPKHYKDPEKIAAWQQEAEGRLGAELALDPYGCRICALGWATAEDLQVWMITTPEDELIALRHFLAVWRQHRTGPLMGYNVIGFDLPVLQARCFLQGLTWPVIADRPYNTPDVHDLYLDVKPQSGKGAIPRDLETIARRFGITPPNPDAITGADVPRLYEQGDYETITRHCERDLRITQQLARDLQLIDIQP